MGGAYDARGYIRDSAVGGAMKSWVKWAVGGFLGLAVIGGVLNAVNPPAPAPEPAAAVAAPVVVAPPEPPAPAPVASVPDGAVLDDGARAACDSLAYDINDAGGAEALTRVDVERWAVMVRQYRHALGGTGNVLIRDSAEILTNGGSANGSARMLALDTAAGRCFDAGWVPN